MHLEPFQQINLNIYNLFEINISSKKFPELVKILKCLPTKNKIE